MFMFLLNIISFIFQSPDKLNQDIDRYLAKEIPGYEKIEFKIVKMPQNFSKLEINESMSANISGNIIYIPILLTDKENRTNKTYLTVNIKLYKTVYCAKGDIERKKELKDTDFEIKQVDVAGTHGKIISLDEKISLYRTKSIIRKGEALVSDLLEKIPIVRAGDRVKAYYLDGNIEVNFYVLAKQDGVEGDIIHVTKMDDNKQYKAKIVDSNNVLINE